MTSARVVTGVWTNLDAAFVGVAATLGTAMLAKEFNSLYTTSAAIGSVGLRRGESSVALHIEMRNTKPADSHLAQP